MSIFKRARDIIAASINDMLAQAEDPEDLINRMIREMEEHIVRLRREAAAAVASHNVLKGRLAEAKSEQRGWEDSAERAVEDQDDDAARHAIENGLEAEAAARSLRGQTAEAAALARRLREELRRLEDRVQEARTKRSTLLMKKRLMRSQRELAETAAGRAADSAAIIEGFDTLSERIEREADEADAWEEVGSAGRGEQVDETLDRMKRQEEVERELKELKRKGARRSEDDRQPLQG